GVDLGPVWQLADQIEIDAHGEALVEGLVLNAGAFVFDPLELAAGSAQVVGIGIEGFGIVGPLEFEAATDLDWRSDKIEESLEIFWVCPTGGVSGQRLAKEGRIETGFVREIELTRDVCAVVARVILPGLRGRV